MVAEKNKIVQFNHNPKFNFEAKTNPEYIWFGSRKKIAQFRLCIKSLYNYDFELTVHVELIFTQYRYDKLLFKLQMA